MVQTAETDVVRPAVASEDPSRFFDQVVLHREDLLADVATAGFHHRDQASGDFLGRLGIVHLVEPLLHYAFQLVGTSGIAFDGFLHQHDQSFAQFLDADVNAQAELGVVLE